HWVIDDDLGSLWLNTTCGLIRAAAADIDGWVADRSQPINFALFDSSDGFRPQAIASGYEPFVVKARDGRLWFAREGGVDIVDPRHLPFNGLPPAVHIERVVADRKIYE